jgi:hypothetical protein
MAYWLSVPTDPEELANVLDENSNDWKITLDFLSKFGKASGIPIDTDSVSNIIIERIEEWPLFGS